MPVDIEARVLSNTRLSPDYNVITLAAPGIAAATAPGQFVMVKPGRGHDPLLRRPFSVFEILREPDGPDSREAIDDRADFARPAPFAADHGFYAVTIGRRHQPQQRRSCLTHIRIIGIIAAAVDTAKFIGQRR
jgi:hypothetical protein